MYIQHEQGDPCVCVTDTARREVEGARREPPSRPASARTPPRGEQRRLPQAPAPPSRPPEHLDSSQLDVRHFKNGRKIYHSVALGQTFCVPFHTFCQV